MENIYNLLKSLVYEDHLIGLNILVNNYSKQEIIDFFEIYGTRDNFDDNFYIRSSGDMVGKWQYLYKDSLKLAFFLRDRCIIVKHPHANSRYFENIEL